MLGPTTVQNETGGTLAAADLEAGLARLGYASFRPGQREAIETLLDAGRLLLVAPTGGGKSLIYQLPAALLPGTTLVISPLVALMHDQCQALEGRGVPATFLAATLPGAELRERMARTASGAYKIVYAAPERLVFAGFRSLLQNLGVPLIAVDEAHCISEWGHDFRPEYLAIGDLLRELPGARVLACTATATPVVRDEIVARLGLPVDTPQVVRGFARPNLALRAEEVSTQAERRERVDAMLAETLGRPGSGRGVVIVYTPTRALAEEEAGRLQRLGWRSDAYHAGLDPARRAAAQRAFQEGSLDVIAATIAFGMGIDRPDVRAVVHLAPPSSIEAYYQEVGRAGRDGAKAWGLVLMLPSDLPLRRRMLEGSEGATPEIVAHKWGLYLELLRWIEGGSCRHDSILRYFGDEAETLAGCGHCDVCEALADGEAAQDPEVVTLVVRKALSGVARVHGRFGLTAAVHLLHGTPDPRLTRAGLDGLSTFGVLREHGEEWLVRLLRRCITAGWVELTPGERPVVLLTEAGRAVMRAERPARLLLPAGTRLKGGGGRRRDRTAGAAAQPAPRDAAAMDAETQACFEALRRMRLELAQAEGVPAFVIASDRTLRALAESRPRSLHELGSVYGIGPAKSAKYGAAFLAAVAARRDDESAPPN